MGKVVRELLSHIDNDLLHQSYHTLSQPIFISDVAVGVVRGLHDQSSARAMPLAPSPGPPVSAVGDASHET
jgi:hypothetical protein